MSNDEKRIEIESFLKDVAKKIDPIIKEILVSGVDRKFHNIVKYQINTGGKRLRPALAIICCKMLGGNTKNVLQPAAGLEILHNYTLIVDDIIDNSKLRRSKLTVWSKFGRSIAECIAIYYSAAVFQSSLRSKKHIENSKLFARTLKSVMDGEILDILFEQSGRESERYIKDSRYKKVDLKDYLKMISKKTASLFAASCELGAVASGASKLQRQAISNYGFNFGMAFQITDDILDIFGKKKKFGKSIGQDIAESKLGNIAVLYSLRELNASGRKKMLALLRKKETTKADVKKVIKIMRKTDVIKKSGLLAKSFIKKAQRSLDALPQNKWKKTLAELADSLIERDK